MKAIRNNKGSVALIVAGALVIILGFSALVIDMGSAYHATSRLQNGLDSAALAGVKELGSSQPAGTASPAWSSAVIQAVRFGGLNGYTPAENGLTVSAIYSQSGTRITGIKVTGSQLVRYSIARIFGINDTTVTRTASAMLKVADGVTGVIPFYMAKEKVNIAPGTTITISQKELNGGQNSRIGPIYLNASESGEKIIKDNIVTGYPGYVDVGQKVYTKTGNFSTEIKNAIKTRISNEGPIALVPVVERYYQGDTNENGIFESNENMTGDTNANRVMDTEETWVIESMKVAGFAVIELGAPQGNPEFTMTAKFVTYVPPGGKSRNLDAVDYGVYTIDLVN